MLIVLSPQCTADPKNMTEIIIFIALIMLSIYINILALQTSQNIDLNYGCFDKKKGYTVELKLCIVIQILFSLYF